MKGTVYLLCFSDKLSHAKHYIGWTQHLAKRLQHHRAGTGARIMAAVVERGLDFKVAKTWKGVDRHFERMLKNKKNAKFMCPICSPEG